ncbi:MAG: helix-turn-helix domain-containing protein [Tessaracoccus sp.]|uniref:helix-turn-helix domain-containing protein n=1 Tax=Tessaracoccus sp. TaxID=1971211 RepID=UPI001EB87AC7|nr:helix-turn-helix domain-containing protein [Tessaracoccus sp.]MBK7821961.1 helix-turn-helix domain-containing protein [Tessaracoccus sp.]
MSDLSTYLANAKLDRSIDDIAAAARRGGHPLSRSVIAKYLRGEHGTNPPESTLAALAVGLGVDVRELRRLAGKPAGELGPYVPTAEAASLTQRQRDALDQMIKAFVSEGGSNDGSAPEAKKRLRVVDGAMTPKHEAMVDDGNVMVDWAAADGSDLTSPPSARDGRGHDTINTARDPQQDAGEESQDDGGMNPA